MPFGATLPANDQKLTSSVHIFLQAQSAPLTDLSQSAGVSKVEKPPARALRRLLRTNTVWRSARTSDSPPEVFIETALTCLAFALEGRRTDDRVAVTIEAERRRAHAAKRHIETFEDCSAHARITAPAIRQNSARRRFAHVRNLSLHRCTCAFVACESCRCSDRIGCRDTREASRRGHCCICVRCRGRDTRCSARTRRAHCAGVS